MSYLTRTKSGVMVDQGCFTEALERIQATNIRHQGSQISLTINGQSYTFERLKNGTYSWRGEEYLVGEVNQVFRQIEQAYSQIQHERQEAERREKERIANLQKQLDELNASTSFDGVKHEEIESKKAEIEAQMATSATQLARLEQQQADFERSRQHYLSTTKEQVETSAKQHNWGLTAMSDDTQARRTHIQLRRKVSN